MNSDLLGNTGKPRLRGPDGIRFYFFSWEYPFPRITIKT